MNTFEVSFLAFLSRLSFLALIRVVRFCSTAPRGSLFWFVWYDQFTQKTSDQRTLEGKRSQEDFYLLLVLLVRKPRPRRPRDSWDFWDRILGKSSSFLETSLHQTHECFVSPQQPRHPLDLPLSGPHPILSPWLVL